jgi:hypothetical protein
MKSLRESILDDEDVLVQNVKVDISNPISYIISKYTNKKLSYPQLNGELRFDERLNKLTKDFFKFDDGFYWNALSNAGSNVVGNSFQLMDKNSVNIANFTHMLDSDEIDVCLLRPDYIAERFDSHKNYIKNYSKIKRELKQIFKDKMKYIRMLPSNNFDFFVIKLK